MVRLLSLAALACAASTALAASFQQVTGFGSNPTNVAMWIYVPDKLASPPPIVVAIHACHGKASDYYSGTKYKSLADQKGFILIFPSSPNSDGCWKVGDANALKHNGGGDSLGIVSMVRYTISKYKANASRVYATGTSSGAMMTNVLLGAYPDVFAAGSAFAGVAFGCFANPGQDSLGWNSKCATGQVQKTGQDWGNIVRNAYPGYSGKRPKMQVWHGTADAVLNYQNFWEEIKEWTNVLGAPANPTSTQSNSPISGWTRYSYGSNFQAISAAGVTHNIPTQENEVMKWFGL